MSRRARRKLEPLQRQFASDPRLLEFNDWVWRNTKLYERHDEYLERLWLHWKLGVLYDCL